MDILGSQISQWEKRCWNSSFRVRDQLKNTNATLWRRAAVSETRTHVHPAQIHLRINKPIYSTHKSSIITSSDSRLNQKHIDLWTFIYLKETIICWWISIKSCMRRRLFFAPVPSFNKSMTQKSQKSKVGRLVVPVVHLSAFSLGLKLVDSCSLMSFLFHLYFLILILWEIKMVKGGSWTQTLLSEPWLSPYLQVLPGLNLLCDNKHFFFSINPLRKNLILMFSYSCQLLES